MEKFFGKLLEGSGTLCEYIYRLSYVVVVLVAREMTV